MSKKLGRVDWAFDDRFDGDTVAVITVDYPAKLNILNTSMIEQFQSVIDEVLAVDSLRCVVLTGAGERAFIGGADIREMAGLDSSSARDFITGLHRVCEGLRSAPVPVIARIQGYCLGAGMEIAAACDLRATTEGAEFGMPEVRVGIPSVIEAALLPTLIGWGRTRELLYTGRIISAPEAGEWNFVERLVSRERLDDVVNEWIAEILETGKEAVRLQKALIRQWEQLPMPDAINAGIDAFAKAYETDEPRRMMERFLKRDG